MLKLALRGVLAHKGRLALTLLAVALGVAFVGGVLVLTDTMNKSFDDLFASAYKGTDAVVRSDQTIDQGFGAEEERGDVDASLLETVQGAPEVAAAEGEVTGFVQIIKPDGDTFGNPTFGQVTQGANWKQVPQLNAWDIREGKAPSAAGEVVMDVSSAKSTKYKVGDTVPLQTKQGLADYSLVGLAGFGDVDSPAGQSYVLFTTEQAQQLLDLPDKFASISVVAADGVSQAQLVDDLKPVVGDGVEVLTGQEITDESQSELRKSLSFLTTFFLVFAVIALVVGSFVIYNSFSIVVAQRTREMALLRAIGASRRQVRREVLVESIVVGLVGSAVGFLMGLAIAKALAQLMDVDGSLAVLPTAVVIALLCGVLVTVCSALIPARRASKVPPVAAMREVAVDTTGRSRTRLIFGVLLLAGGAAAVVGGATSETVELVGLGIAAVFAGVILAGPGLAGPVSAAVGWPLTKLRGVTGGLARRNAGRNPRRSASTAQALTIGVAIVAFFLVINSSIRASIDKVFDETFTGDFIVSAGSFGTIGLPNQMAMAIGELQQVEYTVPVRAASVTVDGKAEPVTGTTTDGFGLMGLNVSDGSDALGTDQVVVLKDTAEDQGLKVGDTFDMTFLNTGTAQLIVAGIYKKNDATDLGEYVVGIDEFDRYVPGSTDSMVIVKLRSGESVADTKPVIETAIKPYGVADVESVDDYKKTISSSLDVVLNLILGLLALAIVIAGLGIANTIALSVFERTHELGLLRAVGMSRRQLRSTIRWESVIIALLGTVLGLAVGLLGGWGMVSALRDEGFEVFRVPYTWLVVLVVLAALLGIVAALLPAWRAGRMNVLAAIHTE